MKKNYALSFILGIAGLSAIATNNFTLSPKTDTMDAACGSSPGVLDIGMNNLTSGMLIIDYNVITNTLISDTSCWHLQLCDGGTCYPYIPTSGSFPLINAGFNPNAFILDVTPYNVTGTGMLQIEVYESNTPSNKDTLTIYVNACPTGEPCIISEINEIATEKSVFIYPVPAQNILNVSIKDPGFSPGKTVDFYNIIGENVLSTKLEDLQSKVNISALPSGVYFIQYETSNGRVVAKKFSKTN